jgi:hypothetical protein
MVEVMTTILVVAALLIGGIFIVPGAASSISSIVLNIPEKCDVAPFAPNCYCGEGFTKQPLSTPGKSYCELADLMFDPLSASFEAETLAYAKTYLLEQFPGCDSLECPAPAILSSNANVVLGPKHRSVYFECRGPFGTDYFEFQARLENGDVEKAICTNIYVPNLTEEEKRAEFKRICDESINNQHCNTIFVSTTQSCSTHEIFPAYSCFEGRTCTKGVGYMFQSWEQGNLPGWTGCGYIAEKEWLEGFGADSVAFPSPGCSKTALHFWVGRRN